MKPLNQSGDDLLIQGPSSSRKLNKTFPSQISEAVTQPSMRSDTKLPFFIRYLSIYDIIGNKSVIRMGNFAESGLKIDTVRRDCDKTIDNSKKNGLEIDQLQTLKSTSASCVWVNIVSDRKFLLTG